LIYNLKDGFIKIPQTNQSKAADPPNPIQFNQSNEQA
jgi:hypothetical protein